MFSNPLSIKAKTVTSGIPLYTNAELTNQMLSPLVKVYRTSIIKVIIEAKDTRGTVKLKVENKLASPWLNSYQRCQDYNLVRKTRVSST